MTESRGPTACSHRACMHIWQLIGKSDVVSRSDPLVTCGLVGDAWVQRMGVRKNAFGNQSSLPLMPCFPTGSNRHTFDAAGHKAPN